MHGVGVLGVAVWEMLEFFNRDSRVIEFVREMTGTEASTWNMIGLEDRDDCVRTYGIEKIGAHHIGSNGAYTVIRVPNVDLFITQLSEFLVDETSASAAPSTESVFHVWDCVEFFFPRVFSEEFPC